MRFSPEDRSALADLIDCHGLQNAWRGLLLARIQNSNLSLFAYMTRDDEFADVNCMPRDMLKDKSIGEISVLYEYALAHNDRTKRKIEGQYFTPDDVSRFIADHERIFPASAVWVDPCSGVGNLSYWLLKRQKDPEHFLLERLYLIDTDPLALLTARVFLTLFFQKTERDLFNLILPRFLVRDFLVAKDLPRCDAAILNPPYVSHITNDTFATAPTKNTYAYFLERVATRCPVGYISITPQTFTNGKRFASLRKVLLENHNAFDIYCFDNVPDNIFSGVKYGSGNTNKANSTRAGIIVAHKALIQRHRITPLLRWRSHERARLFESIEQLLAEVNFTVDVFPKIGKELRKFYKTVRGFKQNLSDLVCERKTKHTLQVPSTPRYYISANKRPVVRTSFKTLYFSSAKDLNYAYILLNSSYMYWWWRVHDGGMTISDKTLLELPIPPGMDTEAAKSFIKRLEASERSSKVIKINAGKAIENIKHPQELVRSITGFLFPKHVGLLSETHANSNLHGL